MWKNIVSKVKELFPSLFNQKESTASSPMRSLGNFLVKKEIPPKELEELARSLSLPFHINLQAIQIDPEVTSLVPYSFVQKHDILPLYRKEGALVVALSDPLNVTPLDELRFRLSLNIIPEVVPRNELKNAIHRLYHQTEKEAELLLEKVSENKEESHNAKEETYDVLDNDPSSPSSVQLLNVIISDSIRLGASDIHLDPEDTGMRIRIRIDGVLLSKLEAPSDLAVSLITRLKVMANMDIAERRLPQDGRIKVRYGGKMIDFRVSTLPVSNGERMVLRLLDKGNIVLGLDNLGIPQQVLQSLRNLTSFSEGMILVTGPTGSGKTTTLYSGLMEMKSSEVNIMTIEDPIEYKLPGIAQTAVHPKIGLTFATGLRHILRQDPDIIMIGEIRDRETAEIAIQSALTGHLVLSTLHTNDAASAIVRLVDMGIEPYLISSCLLGVLAQRLVRKTCPSCRPTPKKECPQCLGSGFSGRHGIYELMPITYALKKQIAISPESETLKQIALQEGMHTLKEHGQDLIAQGLTTQEELWRVTRGSEDDA
jgi:general secretion pathway protein E